MTNYVPAVLKVSPQNNTTCILHPYKTLFNPLWSHPILGPMISTTLNLHYLEMLVYKHDNLRPTCSKEENLLKDLNLLYIPMKNFDPLL